MEPIKIERMCKPGDVNVNGYKYTIESYNKALEKFNERDYSPFSYVVHDVNDNTEYPTICGFVSHVTDDYISLFPIGNCQQFLLENKDKLKAIMRYIGDNFRDEEDHQLCDIINIIRFDVYIEK